MVPPFFLEGPPAGRRLDRYPETGTPQWSMACGLRSGRDFKRPLQQIGAVVCVSCVVCVAVGWLPWSTFGWIRGGMLVVRFVKWCTLFQYVTVGGMLAFLGWLPWIIIVGWIQEAMLVVRFLTPTRI